MGQITRASLYARVSSEEQVEGYSIDAQVRAFRQLCAEKGWETHREYIEEGKSAHTEDLRKRPVFKQAMGDALATRYDVLVVHKIDRFSRKLRITLEYFEKLGKAEVGFVSIMNNLDYSTPLGKFMLVMQGGLAELYSDNLSEETKKGWHERRKQGFYCGTLPFGVAKGPDGIPMPDMEERRATVNGEVVTLQNFDGLQLAFTAAADGFSDREVAILVNSRGYVTTGTHGPRPFSRDTTRDMLSNRFYIGEIPDGIGGWLKAKHGPFIDPDLFARAQLRRARRRRRPATIRTASRTYSLSCLARCNRCGNRIRIHSDKIDRARVYCLSRIQGLRCDFRGTFLDRYETQIESYLGAFAFPEDYKERILRSQGRLEEAYDNVVVERRQLEANLTRLKLQFRWGHITESDYLSEYRATESQLQPLKPIEDDGRGLEELAKFMSGIDAAWREGSQSERNRIARIMFDDIVLDSDGVLVALKPTIALQPFFRLSFEAHKKSLLGDPEGLAAV